MRQIQRILSKSVLVLNVIPEAWEASGIRRGENLKRENQLKKSVKAVRICRKLQRVTQK